MAVVCQLCPRLCRLEPGQAGDCRVRVNLDGRLVAVTWGLPVSVHVDPMEKKPLFHFLPGSPIFSLATVGCNLHCVHCQNWEISQANPEDHDAVSLPPAQVAALAAQKGCRAVACTYTEPLAWYEYTWDIALACRERGIKTVLVTAGYLNPEPFRAMARVVDAAIMDLKAMSDAHYQEICGGRLEPVLTNLRIAREEGLWLEVLNLLVPTLNDGEDLIRDLVHFVRDDLGPQVPLHFTAFHPAWRLRNLPRTPLATLERARNLALDAGLHHVYTGNIPGTESESTFCPDCEMRLVHRVGYRILENLLSSSDAPGTCPTCGARVAGVWT